MLGQDIIAALWLTRPRDGAWTYATLAHGIGLTASQAHASVGRLRHSRLMAAEKQDVSRAALLEFLEHGLPYAFPAHPGVEALGVPTATSVESLRPELKLVSGHPLIWPYIGGSVRGSTITPLHRAVPAIAVRDRTMHELLAIVDCLRLGRVRERVAAMRVLKQRLAR